MNKLMNKLMTMFFVYKNFDEIQELFKQVKKEREALREAKNSMAISYQQHLRSVRPSRSEESNLCKKQRKVFY